MYANTSTRLLSRSLKVNTLSEVLLNESLGTGFNLTLLGETKIIFKKLLQTNTLCPSN